MRASKLTLFLGLLGALTLAACAPGSNHTSTNPNAKPTRLQINAYEVTSPTPVTLLIENAETVQKVYTSAVALPVAPTQQACPAIAGPRYELTFWDGDRVVAKAVADRSGCASLTFGIDDIRQPNEAFWQLLNQVIAQATPPTQPDRAEVVSFTGPQRPPTLSTIASADQARQLYDAVRALPELPANTSCLEPTGTRYTLLFFEGEKHYQAALDKNGCIAGPTNLAEHHQADDAFWQLLRQTLASVPTETARPDTLYLKTMPVSSDPSTTASAAVITNQDVVQKLYNAIYALPKPPSDLICAAVARTSYGLTFSKDGVELLTAIANKSDCGTVRHEGFVRLANQAFWDLVRQAATQ